MILTTLWPVLQNFTYAMVTAVMLMKAHFKSVVKVGIVSCHTSCGTMGSLVFLICEHEKSPQSWKGQENLVPLLLHIHSYSGCTDCVLSKCLCFNECSVDLPIYSQSITDLILNTGRIDSSIPQNGPSYCHCCCKQHVTFFALLCQKQVAVFWTEINMFLQLL
jgi:hypothetical protein